MTPKRTAGQPLTGQAEPFPWDDTEVVLAGSRFYWLATVGPRSRPHLRPVLAVWLDRSMFSTTGPKARKGRNLADNGQCALSARTSALDVVLEGEAKRVVDEDVLRRVAVAYDTKYGWPVTIVDGTFAAPYGAPTAGPPPYYVYEIRPETVFAFTTDESPPRPTRWRFL